MSKKTPLNIKWLKDVKEQDYPAAESYLNLIYSPNKSFVLISTLRTGEITTFKSKDIFRASGLSLLGVSNSHVKKDTRKIEKGEALSPLLLVRDEIHGKVVIADGYHRLCAVYRFDEDALIPCKIV